MTDSFVSITSRQIFLLASVVGAAVANIHYIQNLRGAPDAKSRLNMVYMFVYFLAGSLRLIAGSKAWETFGWSGVCVLGLVATIGATVPLVAALNHRVGSQAAAV